MYTAAAFKNSKAICTLAFLKDCKERIRLILGLKSINFKFKVKHNLVYLETLLSDAHRSYTVLGRLSSRL